MFEILKRSSLILIIITFTALIVQILDLSAGDIGARKWKDPDLFMTLFLYSIIIVASLFTQFYFLLVTAKISLRSKKPVSLIAIVTAYMYIAAQSAVIVMMIYILAEQLLTNQYYIIIPQAILALSTLSSVAILILLSYTCIKTYLTTKNKMVLIYGIATLILSVQLVTAILYIEANLANKPLAIKLERNPWISGSYNSFISKLFQIYNITHAISFIAVWIASVTFTKALIHNIGKVKYLITVSIPLIYFSLQYLPDALDQFGLLTPLLMTANPLFQYFNNFVVNTIYIGSGMLFGISFFILSRDLIHDELKYYLIMCGCGIMMVFSSNISTVLIKTVFPAWGLISMSFVLPASFMILIGLNSSASFISNDYKIRALLNKSRKEFRMFGAFGTAEYSTAIERKVRAITGQILENPENQALFVSKTESEDINQYVQEVMKEMRRSSIKYKNSKFSAPTDKE